jgi:peptidoglycan/LPS O-acetylase OafA/YrhL
LPVLDKASVDEAQPGNVVLLRSRPAESAATRRPGTAAPTQKLMGLELLRFTAAIAVLFWHYQNLWYTPAGLVGFVRENQPFYRYFSVFYQFGLYGVQVFWSISGYIFFWKYREAVAERRVDGYTFFMLRFSRLYPLHFATLILVAALQLFFVGLKGYPFVYGHDNLFHFVLQLFFASNWGFQDGSSFNGPVWSISIEVLVYVGFFAVLRYLGSSILVSIGIVVAAAAAYMMKGHNPIFQSFVCFYVGGICATVAGLPAVQRHRKRALALAVTTLVLVPILCVVLAVSQTRPLLQFVVIGYIPVALYVLAEHVQIPNRLCRSVETAGNMTYSSYLIHFPVQLSIAIVCAALGLSIPKESLLFFCGYFASVLALSVLIYRYFEMPCQRLIRRRFAFGRSRG